MAVARGYAALSAVGKRFVESADGPADETDSEVLLCLYEGHLVALHGFLKKTRATPEENLALARKRQKELKG